MIDRRKLFGFLAAVPAGLAAAVTAHAKADHFERIRRSWSSCSISGEVPITGRVGEMMFTPGQLISRDLSAAEIKAAPIVCASETGAKSVGDAIEARLRETIRTELATLRLP